MMASFGSGLACSTSVAASTLRFIANRNKTRIDPTTVVASNTRTSGRSTSSRLVEAEQASEQSRAADNAIQTRCLFFAEYAASEFGQPRPIRLRSSTVQVIPYYCPGILQAWLPELCRRGTGNCEAQCSARKRKGLQSPKSSRVQMVSPVSEISQLFACSDSRDSAVL